jgi:hypothetical protein
VYIGVNALYLYPRYAKISFDSIFHSGSSLCRWIVCRQRALRSFAAVYIGVNALYLYPRYAKDAFSSTWPWLLRYSNAWVLLMTAVGLMVSARYTGNPEHSLHALLPAIMQVVMPSRFQQESNVPAAVVMSYSVPGFVSRLSALL